KTLENPLAESVQSANPTLRIRGTIVCLGIPSGRIAFVEMTFASASVEVPANALFQCILHLAIFQIGFDETAALRFGDALVGLRIAEAEEGPVRQFSQLNKPVEDFQFGIALADGIAHPRVFRNGLRGEGR